MDTTISFAELRAFLSAAPAHLTLNLKRARSCVVTQRVDADRVVGRAHAPGKRKVEQVELYHSGERLLSRCTCSPGSRRPCVHAVALATVALGAVPMVDQQQLLPPAPAPAARATAEAVAGGTGAMDDSDAAAAGTASGKPGAGQEQPGPIPAWMRSAAGALLPGVQMHPGATEQRVRAAVADQPRSRSVRLERGPDEEMIPHCTCLAGAGEWCIHAVAVLLALEEEATAPADSSTAAPEEAPPEPPAAAAARGGAPVAPNPSALPLPAPAVPAATGAPGSGPDLACAATPAGAGLRYRVEFRPHGALAVQLQQPNGETPAAEQWQEELLAGLGAPREPSLELFAAAEAGGLEPVDLHALAALRALAEEGPGGILTVPPAYAGACLAALLPSGRVFAGSDPLPLRLEVGSARVDAEIDAAEDGGYLATIRVAAPPPPAPDAAQAREEAEAEMEPSRLAPAAAAGASADAAKCVAVPGIPAWAVSGQRVHPLPPAAAKFACAATDGRLPLPVDAAAELLLTAEWQHPWIRVRARQKHRCVAVPPPRPLLSLRANAEGVEVDLRFDYGGEVRAPRLRRIETDAPGAVAPTWEALPGWVVRRRERSEHHWMARDVVRESAAAQELADWGAELRPDGGARLRGAAAVAFVNRHLPALDPADWELQADPSIDRWRLFAVPAEIYLELAPVDVADSGGAMADAAPAPDPGAAPVASRGQDQVLLRVRGEVAGTALPIEELRRARAAGEASAPVGSSGRLRLEQAAVAALLDGLIDVAVAPAATAAAVVTYRIPRSRLALLPLRDPLPEHLHLTVAPELRSIVAGLGREAPAALPPLPQLRATLRAYQESGVAWMRFLAQHHLGGILADDMGLGKTVQVLALLCLPDFASAAASRPVSAPGAGRSGSPSDRAASNSRSSPGSDAAGSRRPSLVVAPASVLYSWKDQCAALTPDLRLRILSGADAGEAIAAAANAEIDLLVCSFAGLRRNIDALASIHWRLFVVDEAQFLKNAATQGAMAARRISADSRWALTGTPIENHLGELHAITDLVLPGLLGPRGGFERRFAAPIAAGSRSAAERLRRYLRPYLLRRVKAEVARDLPPKSTVELRVPLPPGHAAAYRQIAAEVRLTLRGAVAERGLRHSGTHILTALMRLRQAACHPLLANPDGPYAALDTAKLLALQERLPAIVEEGHSALLFSSFTGFLDQVEALLRRLNLRYLRLDGRTRSAERERRIAAFQSPAGPPLFLISLRAGGTGLNLTRADYVFQLDPWWNPAAEEQAADRAHRIGRQGEVIIYRLYAADTIETRIRELQQRKRELVAQLLGGAGDAFSKSLSIEELEELVFSE